MKSVQRIILKFLEIDEDYQNLISLLQEEKIQEDRYEMKSILKMISAIS